MSKVDEATMRQRSDDNKNHSRNKQKLMESQKLFVHFSLHFQLQQHENDDDTRWILFAIGIKYWNDCIITARRADLNYLI